MIKIFIAPIKSLKLPDKIFENDMKKKVKMFLSQKVNGLLLSSEDILCHTKTSMPEGFY